MSVDKLAVLITKISEAIKDQGDAFPYRTFKRSTSPQHLFILGNKPEGVEEDAEDMALGPARDGYHLHLIAIGSDTVTILAFFTRTEFAEADGRRASALSQLAAASQTPDSSNKYHIPIPNRSEEHTSELQ